MQTSSQYAEKSPSELLKLLAERDTFISQQSQQINLLTEAIRLARIRHFGTKSEKMDLQASFFDEAVLPKKVEKIEEAEVEIQVASYSFKKKPGRKALPANLPRVQRIYDLTEAEKQCVCGSSLTHITDDKTEQLEMIPAQIYVIEHVRKKYACKRCEETIKTAALPALPIPRSIASSGLLSHVLVSKFQDHLPLYRQEQILRRIGIDIPRSTLCLWVIRCAEILNPLMQLMKAHILQHDVAYSDETTLQVLKESNKVVQSKKYMWVFAGSTEEKFAFYYQYHPSRGHEVAEAFFTGFKGYLHCDGYGAYETLANKNNRIKLAGCLYHARRKFIEVIKLTKSKEGIAVDVVAMIAKLSVIEVESKEMQPKDRFDYRIERAKPVLEKLYDYLKVKQLIVPPKSALGLAINYTLNQWKKLLNYLEDGRLENNNNRTERAIKPFAIGRKGWLFANSVTGAHAAATIFSFVETCKWHEIEAYDWFKFVLEKIPSCKNPDELETLLPFNIDKSLIKNYR